MIAPMRSLAVSILCALALAACDRAAAPPHVVVIVMDTARPDLLSAYGHPRPTSPFLDSLLSSSTRFDRAYSTSCWTLPSHASLFSGVSNEVHHTIQASTRFPSELPLLAEELAARGYQTAGFSNNPWISATTGLNRGFATFVDRWRANKEAQAGRHPTIMSIEAWLRDERDPEKPAFVFVNLTEPHMPYRPRWEHANPFMTSQEEWRTSMTEFFPPRTGATALMLRHYSRQDPLDPRDWPRISALYEGELRACDDVVRGIVERLDDVLPPEKTLLFVLSDHGENLGDHDHVNHVFNLYESNLRIVLLARGPGFAPGAQERRLVQITDLHPTILAAAGVEDARAGEAIDLRGALPDERVLRASLDWPKLTLTVFPDEVARDGGPLDRYKHDLAAAVSRRWKLIRSSDGRVEAFDLENDPHERTPIDLERVEPRVHAALLSFLDRTDARPGASSGSGTSLPTDPATLEALRSLGYTR
jgi:arylsulfatase A-like enzyme